MALRWQEQGASRLHVIDLDGAFSGEGMHVGIARAIFGAVRIPVQFGGGLRTLDQIERILDMGADRAIVGTVALRDPDVVEQAVRRRGQAVLVGIDARAGSVAVQGWIEQSSESALQLARRVAAIGIERIVYTDIARDGMLAGVNVEQTAAIAQASGLKVIASGGVATEADVRAVWARRECGIEGIILGRALYEGTVHFRDVQSRVAHW
jgi:phosphoribosylformimino-5-aminoimidazole carboxamide ribotide isomerase